MHWVDRGPEPGGLPAVRSRYTPRWVQHYRDGMGTRPTDSQWRRFHGDVGQVFSWLCAYCEQFARGEVDHFRPKNRFPERVYEWSNWVFACHDCNSAKLDKWPPRGYVDPCAKSRNARPEKMFTYDTLTAEVIPNPGMSSARRRKARQTIDDIGINDDHHLKKRIYHLFLISEVVSQIRNPLTIYDRRVIDAISAWDAEFSSITRTLLVERGYMVP
ncbi:MAG: HNH endonuclease [Chloroflexi bacterium]|nr:HNH endonuclease [Chloroflexota bacterium]